MKLLSSKEEYYVPINALFEWIIESMYGDREEAQEGKFSRWPAASELLQLTTNGTSPK